MQRSQNTPFPHFSYKHSRLWYISLLSTVNILWAMDMWGYESLIRRATDQFKTGSDQMPNQTSSYWFEKNPYQEIVTNPEELVFVWKLLLLSQDLYQVKANYTATFTDKHCNTWNQALIFLPQIVQTRNNIPEINQTIFSPHVEPVAKQNWLTTTSHWLSLPEDIMNFELKQYILKHLSPIDIVDENRQVQSIWMQLFAHSKKYHPDTREFITKKVADALSCFEANPYSATEIIQNYPQYVSQYLLDEEIRNRFLAGVHHFFQSIPNTKYPIAEYRRNEMVINNLQLRLANLPDNPSTVDEAIQWLIASRITMKRNPFQIFNDEEWSSWFRTVINQIKKSPTWFPSLKLFHQWQQFKHALEPDQRDTYSRWHQASGITFINEMEALFNDALIANINRDALEVWFELTCEHLKQNFEADSEQMKSPYETGKPPWIIVMIQFISLSEQCNLTPLEYYRYASELFKIVLPYYPNKQLFWGFCAANNLIGNTNYIPRINPLMPESDIDRLIKNNFGKYKDKN